MSKRPSKVVNRILQQFTTSSPEQQALIQENKRLKEMLENRSTLEELGLLTATIEHDIKSPLAVIDTILHRMVRRFQANSEILAGLEDIDRQKRRIYATATMIRVVRADTTLSDLQTVKVNIGDFMNHCIKEVKQEANMSEIFFRLNIRKALFIEENPPLLQQAIVNILKNAIEAIHKSDRHRGLIDVSVVAESSDAVKIEIGDDGCGIRDEDMPNLPNPYFTSKGTRTPNSGLGLFITDKIVKLHQGRIAFKRRVE